jgi:hypothetical protein
MDLRIPSRELSVKEGLVSVNSRVAAVIVSKRASSVLVLAQHLTTAVVLRNSEYCDSGLTCFRMDCMGTQIPRCCRALHLKPRVTM